MMFLVGIELIKFAKDIRLNKDLIPMAVTVIVSLATIIWLTVSWLGYSLPSDPVCFQK
jgi:L-lactate permease